MASETFTVNIEAKNTATQQLIAVRESLQRLQVQSTETARIIRETSTVVKDASGQIKTVADASALAAPALGGVGEKFEKVSRLINMSIPVLGEADAAYQTLTASGVSSSKALLASARTLVSGIVAQFDKLRIALIKNPFTAVAVLVLTAAAGAYAYAKNAAEAERATKRLAAESRRAREDVEALFSGVDTEDGLAASQKSFENQLKSLDREIEDAEIDEEEDKVKELSQKRIAILDAAYEAEIEAEKRIAEKKLQTRLERIRKEREAEITVARERAIALRTELEKLETEELRVRNRIAAGLGARAKLNAELSIAGVGNLEALHKELEFLEAKLELTADEAARVRELLEAKKKIAAIEASAEAVRQGLRQKIMLMEAEIAGTEQLAAAKEKLYRAEVKSQFLKAGLSSQDAEAATLRYLNLEKQLEQVRKERIEAEKLNSEEKSKEASELPTAAETRQVRRESIERVQTSQASIGGGRTLDLGSDSLSIQRQQLNVQQQLLSAFKSFSPYKSFSEHKTFSSYSAGLA